MSILTADRKVRLYAQALTESGIPVPEEIATGLEAASWQPGSQLGPDTVASVSAAATEDEFRAAYARLVREAAAELHAQSPGMKDLLDNVRVSRAMSGVYETADSVYEQIVVKFNDAAPAFEEAVGRIPDLSMLKPIDITPETADAITEAKRAAAVLAPLWSAYTKLGFLTMRFEIRQQGEAVLWTDYISSVHALGIAETQYQVEEAARLMFSYSLNGDGLTLAPLAPFAAMTLKGIPLCLTTPEEAEDRRDDLQHKTTANVKFPTVADTVNRRNRVAV